MSSLDTLRRTKMIDKMKAKLILMEKTYKNREYFGKLSDLLAEIYSLRSKIERLENDKNTEN